MKYLIIALICVLLTGCISIPKTTLNPIQGNKNKFQAIQKICVTIPVDASFAGENYVGSGRAVAQAISDSLSRIDFKSSLIEAKTNQTANCTERGGDLILFTEIMHYEDHATGWNGKPDRIEIRLVAYKSNNPEVEKTIVFEALSSLMASAFFEWGNAPPYALISTNLDPVLKELLLGNKLDE